MMTSNDQHITTARKIWVSDKELKSLVSTLGEELSKRPDDDMLRALHDEVAVARQRFANATDQPQAVARALGQDEDAIPLALNLTEASYLCSISSVTRDVRMAVLRGLL